MTFPTHGFTNLNYLGKDKGRAADGAGQVLGENLVHNPGNESCLCALTSGLQLGSLSSLLLHFGRDAGAHQEIRLLLRQRWEGRRGCGDRGRGRGGGRGGVGGVGGLPLLQPPPDLLLLLAVEDGVVVDQVVLQTTRL